MGSCLVNNSQNSCELVHRLSASFPGIVSDLAHWTAIPSQTYVVWWVVGLDGNRSPISTVNSDEYGWFQKQ